MRNGERGTTGSKPEAFHSEKAETLRVRHAHRGMKLIIPAEILAILRNALLIGVIVMQMVKGTAGAEPSYPVRLCSSLLLIVRFVLMLVGCGLSGRDDERFSKARTAMIVAVVFGIYNFVLSSLVIGIAEIIANVWATIYVIEAVSILAISQGDVPLSEAGRKLFLPVYIACGFHLVTAVLDAAFGLFSIQGANIIVLASALLFLVLEIAVSVLLLRYLFRAERKLHEIILSAAQAA